MKHNKFYTGALQLINALISNDNFKEFKDAAKYFEETWKNIPKSNFSIKDTIDTILKFGGIAVLAHPNNRDCNKKLITVEGFQELKDFGLNGIEVYHPSLNKEDREYLLEIANRFNFIITGGSDEHGLPDGFQKMGKEPVPYELSDFRITGV